MCVSRGRKISINDRCRMNQKMGIKYVFGGMFVGRGICEWYGHVIERESVFARIFL